MEIPVIFENQDILVIDKPAGVGVYDLAAELAKTYPAIELVHRLDKDTSGVIALAKSEASAEYLREEFKRRKVKKVYRLIASGKLLPEQGRPTGTVSAPIGRHPSDARQRLAGGRAVGVKREAITHYQILENFATATYLEARPITGRTHQLRVHFRYLGHPVLGDRLYGGESQIAPRQMLHAYRLKLVLPGGAAEEFIAPLPADFAAALDYFRRQC